VIFSTLTPIGKDSVMLRQTLDFLRTRMEVDRVDQLNEEEAKFFDLIKDDTVSSG